MKKYNRLASLLVLFFFWHSFALASGNQKIDSLLHQIGKEKLDVKIIKVYIQVGDYFEGAFPDSAKEYYQKAIDLSKKIKNVAGYCEAITCYSNVLLAQGQFDLAISLSLDAYKYARAAKNEEWMATTNVSIGNGYNCKLQYETSLKYYMDALPYFENKKLKYSLAQVYDVMQVLYQNMKQYDKAVYYGTKAVEILSNHPNVYLYVCALLNLSSTYTYTSPPQHKKAIEGLTEVLQIARSKGFLYLESSALVDIARDYTAQNKYKEAEQFFTEGLAVSQRVDNVEGICIAKHGLSLCELYKRNYLHADELIRDALSDAKKYKLMNWEKDCLFLLAQLSLINQNFTDYRLYETQSDSIENILTNDALLRATQEVEAKYESEKKQTKITSLEKEKTAMLRLIAVSIIAFVAIVILLLYRQRIQKNKSLLAEQQILRLEQEKELSITQAVLDGETSERARMSHVLNDELGCNLSAAKLYLKEIEYRGKLNPSEIKYYDKAVELLDESLGNIRRIIHHLMPESLINNGLKTSLTDYCSTIPLVSFHFFGEDRRLDSRLEIIIYRVAYELTNNALKHSGATQINVQLLYDSNRISLVVQDDGTVSNLDAETQDLGLDGIRKRLDNFNCAFDILTSSQQGTEVNVEFFTDEKRYDQS